MNEHELRKEWSKALTDFLTTPPGHPEEAERWKRAHEIDAKCREAGVLPPVR